MSDPRQHDSGTSLYSSEQLTLEGLYGYAGFCGVSLSITYWDSTPSWESEVISNADAECTIITAPTLDTLMIRTHDWLTHIGPPC